MAFKKKGSASDNNMIKVIAEPKTANMNKIATKSDKIICNSCGKHIGMKVGDIYHILDKRLVSLTNAICPKCGKPVVNNEDKTK